MFPTVQEVQKLPDGTGIRLWILTLPMLTTIQKALKEKGLDAMLSEAQDSTTQETDAEHLKRS